MKGAVQWYDGQWLNKYHLAYDYISKEVPEKLSAFEAAISVLKTDLAFEPIHLSEVLGTEVLAVANKVVAQLKQSDYEKHEVTRFGRLVVHNNDYFNALQNELEQLVSELVGEQVEANYNFLSLYSNIGICPIHMDSPEAKWTLDVCLDQSYEWPIHFSQIIDWPTPEIVKSRGWDIDILGDAGLTFTSHSLQPGEAILFSGSAQFHYRDRIYRGNKDDYCNLIFFHFIPFGTKEILNTQNWHKLFDIPALEQLLR